MISLTLWRDKYLGKEKRPSLESHSLSSQSASNESTNSSCPDAKRTKGRTVRRTLCMLECLPKWEAAQNSKIHYLPASNLDLISSKSELLLAPGWRVAPIHRCPAEFPILKSNRVSAAEAGRNSNNRVSQSRVSSSYKRRSRAQTSHSGQKPAPYRKNTFALSVCCFKSQIGLSWP